MTQEESAGVMFRGPDGVTYFIATPELSAFRMSDAEAAEAVELLGGEESVQGFTFEEIKWRPVFAVSVPPRMLNNKNPELTRDSNVKGSAIPRPR